MLVISTAMRIRQYNPECIAHDYRSRATHQTPPLGKYLPHIALTDVMVINFGSKNQVVALGNRCLEASVQKAQNGPSTQLINATSCIEKLNATIQAKELRLSF